MDALAFAQTSAVLPIANRYTAVSTMQAAVLLGFCVAALFSTSWASAPSKSVIYEKAKVCQGKVGATADDLAEVEEHKVQMAGAKKIMACVAKDAKVLVDGKFSAKGAVDLVKEILEATGDTDKDAKLETATAVAEKCDKEITERKPDTEDKMVRAIFMCLHHGADEKGISIGDL